MTEPVIQTPRTEPNGRPANGVHGVDLNLSNIKHERESPPGVPRWVKLLGIAVVVLGLLFAGMHLAGSGGGPGSHFGEQGMQMP